MEKIDQQRLKWMEAIKTGNLEAFAELLTDDAVWLPAGQSAVVGKPAIQTWLAPLFAQFHYDFSISDVKVRVLGDWAVEQARFASKLTDKHSGQTQQHQSRYIILWRRGSEDIWQIERYIDNSV